MGHSLSKSGRAGFTPLRLAPALWLDASEPNTLYDATVGGSLVAPDGAIARWVDKSGNARHATQGTGSSQPLRKTSIQNGRDVVRFDGTNDYLSALSTPMPMADSTVFVVCDSLSASDFLGVYCATPSSGMDFDQVGAYVINTGDNSSLWGIQGGSASNLFLYESGAGALPKSILTAKIGGGNSDIYRNGSASLASDNSYTLDAQSTGYLIGCRYLSGAVDTTYVMLGDIYEILVFPTALATADRQAVESYLNSKWAIY